ncbi:ester cyclase [Sinomonas susongensis]|uniref:ester cyclase n=1 Tax=Sinomonas susongensis TaxID=1324851 RepID=UPI0014866BBE|nr:ester cyclase [Sinomonas susongensis]
MAPADNQATFRRVMEEGFGQGNLDVLDELMSPDFIEHEAGPGEGRGLEGVKAIVTMLHTAFPDVRATIEEMSADGDKLWARVVFEGTHTGDLLGIPPTGKPVRVDAIDLCRFEAGKLVEHWGVFDRMGMMEQVGAIPQP